MLSVVYLYLVTEVLTNWTLFPDNSDTRHIKLKIVFSCYILIQFSLDPTLDTSMDNVVHLVDFDVYLLRSALISLVVDWIQNTNQLTNYFLREILDLF